MLKVEAVVLRIFVFDALNAILNPSQNLFNNWLAARIMVLHKKVEVTLPSKSWPYPVSPSYTRCLAGCCVDGFV
eukprot:5653046-Pyramimonas_sp.AAC.1